MRKSAAEIIRSLEMRVARLERQAGLRKNASIDGVLKYNIVAAAIDEIAKVSRNRALKGMTDEKADFTAWFMTQGREGSIPSGVSKSVIIDSLKLALIKPPEWMAHQLPDSPKDRLRLVGAILPRGYK